MRIFNLINKLRYIFLNYFIKQDVYFVVEKADWVIKDIAFSIKRYLTNLKLEIVTDSIMTRNSIVHYGSINTFFGSNEISLPHKSNKIVVTWFHIAPNDERVKLIPKALKYVDIWHTSCNITKNKMIKLGIPKERIVLIPIGIDLNHFYFNNNKDESKEKLSLPKDKIIIGSFQKDGNGWKDGNEPKLIKGPDIFCDVVEKLSKKYDIFVLLTGPARGYVKNRLDKAKIPYKHNYLENPKYVAQYFQAIDLYMVTSREEGGPKAILESLACGVPLVSTKVGMAPDVIIDGINGFLVDIEDTQMIYEKACKILDDKKLQKKFITNGLRDVVKFDWTIIASLYYKRIYKELL